MDPNTIQTYPNNKNIGSESNRINTLIVNNQTTTAPTRASILSQNGEDSKGVGSDICIGFFCLLFCCPCYLAYLCMSTCDKAQEEEKVRKRSSSIFRSIYALQGINDIQGNEAYPVHPQIYDKDNNNQNQNGNIKNQNKNEKLTLNQQK